MKIKSLLPVLTLMALIACTPKQDLPVYQDESRDLDERVADALSRMTTEEKIAIIHAQSKFSSPGVPRLGIPELWTTDGPHGIRPEVLWDEWDQAGWTNDSIVAFPALTCLAATWNPEMAALYGKSIGEEARYREKDVLLGPGVNIARTPLNGRNFEYMGEDPYLAGEMVVPYIREVQKNGVACCVKHYCLNNEETYRHTIDVDLDDRALYEIYLPAFKKAVQEGGSWSIMASYNLYRGQHVCHNERLLNGILKGEWGFDGAVVTDWGGCHDTWEAIHNGLDLEFGTWTDGLTMGRTNSYDSYYMAAPYLELIREGKVGTEELDEKAARVLKLIMRTAMKSGKPFGEINSEAHYSAARRIAGEGIVLLRNENSNLPLADGVRKILVVGENAVKMMTVGGGSSSLKVQKEISPLAGIRARAEAAGAVVEWERGYVGDTGGNYNGVSTGQDLSESRSAGQLIADAVAKAAEADHVIFVGGLNKSGHQDCEGKDREQLGLPYAQDELIEALAKVNSHLTVVLVSGNPVAMPWVEEVPSIVQAWYIGSEAGEAIADVLFGDVNPSGKLPFSFPLAIGDSPAHQEGMSFPNDGKCFYGEGILVGYRWFDTKGIDVLFPFGHGLSYTSFEYSPLAVSRGRSGAVANVSLVLRNTGDRAGAEVVQLYIGDDESSVLRPVKELKGFRKVWLEAGEEAEVKFEIGEEDLQFFDADEHCWKAEAGSFTVYVGSSATDIRCTASFDYK